MVNSPLTRRLSSADGDVAGNLQVALLAVQRELSRIFMRYMPSVIWLAWTDELTNRITRIA